MSNNYRITLLVRTLVRYLDIRENALMLLSASTVKAGTLAASIFYVYLLYSKLEAGSYAYLSLILLVANFLMLLSNILRDLSFVTLKVSGRLPYLDLCILSYIYGFLIVISRQLQTKM